MRVVDKVFPRETKRREVAGKIAQAVQDRIPRARPKSVTQESETLKKSWAKHDPDALDAYLVSGFQNPQVNAQSILARQRLVSILFPEDDFTSLMHDEMEHCVRATKAMHQRARELNVKMGSYLDDTKRAEVLEVAKAIEGWRGDFEAKWASELLGRTADKPLSVLEFACGSANDYRFIDRYGIARFIGYTGINLNDQNIANAKRRYPAIDFQVGSVLDLPFPDRSYDYVMAFDLFEHMSIEAMETAIAQACRLADKGLILTFFSMKDIPEHDVRPVRSYFWNILSQARVQELIEKQFGQVEALRIRDLMLDEYAYGASYNKNAWTFFATRR